MKSLRFGLKALEEKAKIEVRLKSRFALVPSEKEIDTTERVKKSYEYIYMGTNSAPAYIIKFSIADFKETGTITTSYNYLDTVLYDSKNGYLYFATWQSPPAILKVKIADFTIVDAIILDGYQYITDGVIDVDAGLAYFASGFDIIKFDLV
ncbi:MAG: hypothetical protein GXP46_02005, partial [Deferribacteres bacterium]|nr:hypothetical protein [Deferribacteres bacterium]